MQHYEKAAIEDVQRQTVMQGNMELQKSLPKSKVLSKLH